MSRLRWGLDAFIKSMKRTENDIIAFVEGTDVDPYFYNMLLKRSIGTGKSYIIKRSHEIPIGKGKSTFIKLYSYIRDNNIDIGKGYLFFLDKDMDDLYGNLINSKLFIYTKYYNVENYIYRHSDIINAISVTAMLEYKRVKKFLGGKYDLLDTIKVLREWTILCMFSYKKELHSSSCKYSRESPINNPIGSNTDIGKFNNIKEKLSKQYEGDDFENEFRLVELEVDYYLKNDIYDKIINGKWYGNLIRSELDKLDIQYNKKGFIPNLKSSALANLDFSEDWADYFVYKIKGILKIK